MGAQLAFSWFPFPPYFNPDLTLISTLPRYVFGFFVHVLLWSLCSLSLQITWEAETEASEVTLGRPSSSYSGSI